MTVILPQILQLLVTSPGNLIYHLVLAFALMAGLQAVVNLRLPHNRDNSRRYITGFVILLTGQVVLFLASALAYQRVADPQQFLPVFDRAVTAISILWIAWMWTFPQPERAADTANVILNLALLVLWGLSLSVWIPQVGSASFNRSSLDLIWTALELALILLAIGLLVYRKQGSWSVGLGFFLVLLLGGVSHLIWADPNQDFPSIIRLAQICVFPLLPTLSRNLKTVDLSPGQPDQQPQQTIRSSIKAYSLNTAAIRAWLQVANRDNPQEVCPALIQAVSRTLVADLGFLVVAPDQQIAIFQCGYDLIREVSLPGTAVAQTRIPKIATAMQLGTVVRIPAVAKEAFPDAAALAAMIGIKQAGPLLAVPVKLPDVVWAGIIVISPYSKHEWSKDDETALRMICTEAAPLLLPVFSRSEQNTTPSQTSHSLETSALQVEQLLAEQKMLLAEICNLRTENQKAPPPFDMEALIASQEESRAVIARLEVDNQELRDELRRAVEKPDSKRNEQLEMDLQKALEELASLQKMLADANTQILNLQSRPSLAPGILMGKELEGAVAVVQKLSQPFSSLLGYADLLINESPDNLSSTHLDYLDHLKSAIDRMKELLEEYNVSSFGASPVELAPQDVDLNRVLEQVITSLGGSLREKNIVLQMDVPQGLPLIYGDRDALAQIILHLLQNASAATPANGSIQIGVKIDEAKNETPHIVFQITDEGGGIASEDLGRVFSRSSLAEQAPITGLGDSGLGLSLTKTLVEAHGGRIWVESDPGKTSTFSVLLPFRANSNGGFSQAK